MDTNGITSNGVNLTNVISELLAESGGTSGLMRSFEQNGLAGILQSWIGNEMNQPISTEQIGSAFGMDKITALAGKFGISPGALELKLAEFLPQAVDKMTPSGKVPSEGFSLSKLESVAASLFGETTL